MATRASTKTEANSPVSNLVAYDQWLQDTGISAATGWRWRRGGLIVTINIYGRVYVSRDVIAAFEQRAAAGDFAKVHQTPRRKSGSNRDTTTQT